MRIKVGAVHTGEFGLPADHAVGENDAQYPGVGLEIGSLVAGDLFSLFLHVHQQKCWRDGPASVTSPR